MEGRRARESAPSRTKCAYLGASAREQGAHDMASDKAVGACHQCSLRRPSRRPTRITRRPRGAAAAAARPEMTALSIVAGSPVWIQSPARNKFAIGVTVVGRACRRERVGRHSRVFFLEHERLDHLGLPRSRDHRAQIAHYDVEQLVVRVIDQFARAAADDEAQVSRDGASPWLREDAPLVEQPLRGRADETHEGRIGDFAIKPARARR